MHVYNSRAKRNSGRTYNEVERAARREYRKLAAKSKRTPYIRSAYFNKQKIFIDLFWQHLNQKRRHDRRRRLLFYECALELIQNSHLAPDAKPSAKISGDTVFRFYGKTPENELFCVQIKHKKRAGAYYFMSVFPWR